MPKKITKKTYVHLLNIFTWQCLTDISALEPGIDISIDNLCREYKKDNKFSKILNSESSGKAFSFSEVIIIEKLSALYFDIIVCRSEINKEQYEKGDDAYVDSYESIIEHSIERLQLIRKAHPDGIEFFYLDGENIHEKYCPYYVFTDIMMKKVDGLE